VSDGGRKCLSCWCSWSLCPLQHHRNLLITHLSWVFSHYPHYYNNNNYYYLIDLHPLPVAYIVICHGIPKNTELENAGQETGGLEHAGAKSGNVTGWNVQDRKVQDHNWCIHPTFHCYLLRGQGQSSRSKLLYWKCSNHKSSAMLETSSTNLAVRTDIGLTEIIVAWIGVMTKFQDGVFAMFCAVWVLLVAIVIIILIMTVIILLRACSIGQLLTQSALSTHSTCQNYWSENEIVSRTSQCLYCLM